MQQNRSCLNLSTLFLTFIQLFSNINYSVYKTIEYYFFYHNSVNWKNFKTKRRQKNQRDFKRDLNTWQLPNNTHKFYKEFFKVYLTEYEKTFKFIKQENELKRKILKDLITTVKDTSSRTGISQQKIWTMIVNKTCKQSMSLWFNETC